ncbi:MAG: alpha/beta hydrolase [Desulfatibacillum sp.]|nr:alpha/beta hydrolase [Desulfatibacillum sp.]
MQGNVEKWRKRVAVWDKGEVPIEYVAAGDKKDQAMVFVHSLLANWKQFIPQLEHFSKDHYVLSISLRGHGGSGRPAHESPETYSLEKFSSDVLSICDHLGLERFHYVGNSAGGLTGYEFLSRYPERLKTLTTFGSPGDVDFPLWLTRGYGRFMSLVVRVLGQQFYGKVASRAAVCTGDAYQFLIDEVVWEVNWQVVRHVFNSIGKISFVNLLETSTVPILVIHAEKDYGFQRLLRTTYEAEKKNPHLTIKQLANAGHLANLDQPEALNRIIEKFLKEDK